MTIVEKNILAWVDQLGLKETYKKEGEKEGKLSDAKRMLEKGFSIEDIIDITELTREEIITLRHGE